MSKGSKKQYKQYEIRTIEDACCVLKAIIVPVIIDLEKFEKYCFEAEELLEKYKPNNAIPADVYDSIHDKTLYQQRELLRFMADHQSSSFSYISIRNLFEKRGFMKRSLCEESSKTLNELLNLRNWSFHNVQSMLVADLEVAKNSIPEELRDIAEIRPMLNPVVIRKVQDYKWEMLEGFVMHNKKRDKQFSLILSEMKNDYQEMLNKLPNESYVVTCNSFNQEVKYVEYYVNGMDFEMSGSKIASLSMGIQKGKYDGARENYKNIIGED